MARGVGAALSRPLGGVADADPTWCILCMPLETVSRGSGGRVPGHNTSHTQSVAFLKKSERLSFCLSFLESRKTTHFHASPGGKKLRRGHSAQTSLCRPSAGSLSAVLAEASGCAAGKARQHLRLCKLPLCSSGRERRPSGRKFTFQLIGWHIKTFILSGQINEQFN